ncbi:hypothetical protein MTR_5g072950 [Medicago truncatula]|uniref:Uncharacterized protein n=1 Tax=Medicago truncatula TaxID=3880 RepID=G7KEE6_MEDTR|nr:hypothetical protein MTR_5g072950 [Medicago truncatula]
MLSHCFIIDDSENGKPEVPPPKVDIPSGNVKAENAPSIVVPQDVVVSINHQENFTIKQKFAIHNDFLKWLREEARFFNRYCLQVGDGRHNHDMEEVLKGHKIVGRLLGYHDSDDVSDIFQAHPNGIKLFNMLPTVLVMGSIYKTNKYRLPLLEFVSNTYIEYMFSIGFGYMMYEKEDNVTWSHDRCRELLHSKDISPNTDCKVKDLKGKDGKEIKLSEVVKTVMVAWEDIVNFDTEQAYVDNCNRFKVVQRKVVVARLIRNIPRNALHYLAIEARIKDVDYNMKVRIKEQFRQFSLQEMTSMRPPPKKVTP